jgi:hypothetical protein
MISEEIITSKKWQRRIETVDTPHTEHPLTIETKVHQCQAIKPSQLTLEYHHKTNNDISRTTALYVQNDTVVMIIDFIIPHDINESDLTIQAYSIAVPLLVLHHKAENTINEYELDIKCPKRLKEELKKASKERPASSKCISNEWDLLHTCTTILKKLKRYTLQDHAESGFQPLPNTQDNQMWESETIHTTITNVHLQLNRKRVAGDYKIALRQASTAPDIKSYYSDKYEWSQETIADTHWTAHGKSLTKLPSRTCKTITQMIHQWLPVNATYSINAVGTGRLCPFCLTCDKDDRHFLSCLHPTLSHLWAQAARNITKALIRYDSQIDRQILRLISEAITKWRTTPTPTVPTWLHPKYHTLFAKQSTIGWNHLILGRFSHSWQQATNKSSAQITQWLSFTITRIWLEIYSIWKQRCETNHGKSEEEQNRRTRLTLKPKVTELYAKQPDTDHCDQYIFSTSLSDMLARPPAVIKQWLHKATLRLKVSKERHKAKQKADISKIHPFFSKYKKPTSIIPIKNRKTPRPPQRFQTTTLLKFFTSQNHNNTQSIPKDDLFPHDIPGKVQ